MKKNFVVDLAKKHVNNKVPMASSALLCYSDALRLLEKGDTRYAEQRALKSLAYSVGILHPDHMKAKAYVDSSHVGSKPMVLRRDGKEVMRGTEHELVKYIHNHHSYSVSHALKYEGYTMTPT
jgi:hypothetical protein